MFASHARERFADLLQRPDAGIDVLRGTLLIAQEEDPQIRVEEFEAQVEDMAEKLAHLVDAASGFHNIVYALNRFFFEELGFRGDPGCGDDPDDWLMNKVIERRRGSPLTLSVLYREILCRSAGVELEAIDFPGHFLLASDEGEGSLYLDVFGRGQVLLEGELEAKILRPQGTRRDWKDTKLERVGASRILLRLLTQLKVLYARRKDVPRTLQAVERIILLRPNSAEERRDRGILYGLSGYRMAAIADLEDYLTMRPEAADSDRIRRRLDQLLRQDPA